MREQWACLAWAAFAMFLFFVGDGTHGLVSKLADGYLLVFAGFQLGRAAEMTVGR